MKKERKPTSKQALYSSISSYASEVIQRLVQLSKSKNENVALGACKTLLNKTLPDISSIEVTQSSVLDALISEELERYEPSKPVQQFTLSDMTSAQKQLYAEELIEIGQALMDKGRYGKREIRLAQQSKNQILT